jgi:hypothetical protein
MHIHGHSFRVITRRQRQQSMGLTLEEANRIVRGTLAKAQELSIKISAAICGLMSKSV